MYLYGLYDVWIFPYGLSVFPYALKIFPYALKICSDVLDNSIYSLGMAYGIYMFLLTHTSLSMIYVHLFMMHVFLCMAYVSFRMVSRFPYALVIFPYALHFSVCSFRMLSSWEGQKYSFLGPKYVFFLSKWLNNSIKTSFFLSTR